MTFPDAADTSALCPGSPGSTFILPGKYFRPFVFELSLTRPDVIRSFIGRFLSSPSRPGAPDVTAWALVHSTSQLEAALLSPSSLMLGDLGRHCVGSSGGFGGSGESLDGQLDQTRQQGQSGGLLILPTQTRKGKADRTLCLWVTPQLERHGPLQKSMNLLSSFYPIMHQQVTMVSRTKCSTRLQMNSINTFPRKECQKWANIVAQSGVMYISIVSLAIGTSLNI